MITQITNNKFKYSIYAMVLITLSNINLHSAIRIMSYIYKNENDLRIASLNGNIEKAQSLINAGVNVNSADIDGNTALMEAAINGQKKIAELLLNSGTNVNAANRHGITALMFSVCHGYKDIPHILLLSGANVNAASNAGDTALTLAVVRGCKDIVEILLHAGADIEAKCKKCKICNKAIDHALNKFEHCTELTKINKILIVKMLEKEAARRKVVVKRFIENNQKWIKENLAKKITESTCAQLIPEISNIIAEYAIEYSDIPVEYRLAN